ncbi:ABC transporter permease subunit [Neobacillus notoginsengisoli]|uniref:ABC transporter permease subunit n=1 Tax=Neobacillus notoginsengisoli TaxID=1578198 RepID=A0A417YSC7_9BACI|nr:ABC transporter permease subunit [Neobacillus notoginsengisoli]RHW38905.1 ABC transporter permease subunit [Neobacillus notoginsengisoli]
MIIKYIFRQGILWIIVMAIFLALLFLPRDIIFLEPGSKYSLESKYDYSVEKHIAQFKDFFTYVKENKGLGEVREGQSRVDSIWNTFMKSMKITIPALIIGLFGGVAKGVFDYRIRNRKTKIFGETLTRFFMSIPDLFLIIFIQIAIMTAYGWGLLPYMKVYGSDTLSTTILGIIYLTIYPVFYIANITFSSIRDEQAMDYIKTAFSKGTSSLEVLYRHVLKNCYPKILSHTNTITLYTLSNLFIVEKLTNFRGAAYFFYESVASPYAFAVGQSQFPINLFSAAGYIFLFTAVIFLSKVASQIGKNMLYPLERNQLL